MKTNILLPNPVFEASEQLAQKLNMSFDELCSEALIAYTTQYQTLNITEALNEVYQNEPSIIDPVLINGQTASLGEEEW